MKEKDNKWIQVGKIKVENVPQVNETLKEIENIEKFTRDLGEVLDNSKKRNQD
ncbi:hypothetical protein [Peribacillus simplex]|uniref:hypothetical protein n=1 Tax=Peribacillus simplex TaxID=1478 RepID=UPI003D2E51EF